MTGNPPAPPAIDVRGGSGGIVANEEVIFGLAGAYHDAAGELTLAGWELRTALHEVASGVPIHDTLPAAAPRAQLTAVLALAGAVTEVERAGAQSAELSRRLITAGFGYPWDSTLIDDLAGPTLWHQISALTFDGAQLGADLATGNAQRFVVTHPSLVDGVVDHGEQVLLLSPFAPAVAEFELYRALLEALDGHGHAVATGTSAGPPPRSLADLARNLAVRDTGPGGSIDVRIVTGADGSRHVIVDVTGIDSAAPRPPGSDVADLTSCARAIDGRSTAYEQGVFDAMRQAGVRAGDPVMIVGHSLGGMIAVNAARTAARTGRYTITHVVTAGSPVGRTVGGLPANVQVLSLEDRHDLVPLLDGRANPDRANVTTVTGSAGDGRTVTGNHDSRTVYVPLAQASDASDDASVRAFRRSAHGFLSGSAVTTHTYRVVRS